MAKYRKYDLYEGDGEVIREEETEDSGEMRESRRSAGRALPGRMPLGKEDGLRERQAFERREEEARQEQRKHRYFASNEIEDDLGAPSSLFDDFDRFSSPPLFEKRPVYRRPQKHRAAWAVVAVCGMLCLVLMGLLVLPQLMGIRYRFLPNLAFVNGNLIRLDPAREQELAECRQEVFSDRIYAGVYIDRVHVGGMTREEAAQAVAAVNDMGGKEFDITVSIGNKGWHVNSERVPVSRNVAEKVETAWAAARGNSSGIRGTGITPFRERVQKVSELRSSPLSLETQQDYDHEAMREMAEGIANYVNRDPVNSQVASFDFGSRTFTFTDDVPGARIDAEKLYRQLASLLDAGETHTTLRVEPEKLLAEMTKAELVNRFGQISTYTTNTTNNKNRNTNIDLSARAINGMTVLAGETFSFNQATGPRTAEKGYKEAPAIAGGQSRDEVGGGVCQTSSTLFNAVARADLEILERNPHAWPSSYIEKGLDATVNWPGLDFRFRNNTEWPVFIVAEYANRKITVTLYGMSLGADVKIDLESVVIREIPRPEGTDYELNPELNPGESKTTVTGRKGYEVETWKVWYHGGKEKKRELLFTTLYKAYKQKIEYNPR